MSIVTTAPMVDYKSHWLKMMSVPESRAVVGRHDGINGRDNGPLSAFGNRFPIVSRFGRSHFPLRRLEVLDLKVACRRNRA